MGKRILMIDDEIPILEAFQIILDDMGYDVEICSDALDGERLAVTEKFDMVLVDLRMPQKNGAEVTKAIHEKQPGTIILIVTGYPGDPLAQKALEYGATGLLKKPFEIGKILDFLQNA